MHIVYVTSELATKENMTGGLGTFVANMARIFTEHGHKVDILVVSTKKQELYFDEDIHVENIHIPMSEWQQLNGMAKVVSTDEDEGNFLRRYTNIIYKAKKVAYRINEINKKEKIDLVHYSNHGCFQLFADDSIPYVVRISGFLNIWHGADKNQTWEIESDANVESWSDKMENELLRSSRRVIAPSNLLKDIGEKKIGISHIDVIESPYVYSESSKDYSLFLRKLKDKKYILHFGTLSFLKGSQVVANLVEDFLNKHQDMYLVLAGRTKNIVIDGKDISFPEYIREKAGKDKERVIYLGGLNREQLYPVIENAEVCLLPSRIENLPNACIEAMSMGKIVVATNGASYEQLISNKENGFLCEKDNPKSFLNAIEEIFELDEDKHNRISINAKKTVERMNPNHAYERYMQLYENVISEWSNV